MLATLLTLPIAATAAGDLPPSGRSRFDQLIGDAPVPFPFARLADKLNAQMLPEPGGLPPLKVTLIPLGRSLQRDAGAPDFFRFPRVVAAADGVNRPGFAPLKDRLFLGFHEKGEVIEVISYNDDAGRFEFQIVRDYARGKTPQVFYARRSLCLACHQNAAPIFARPLWDETPANPAIAAGLRAARRDFYGVRISGTDIAYFIDAASDRANLFSVWQALWQHGCGAGDTGDACRMDAFAAALAYARDGILPAANALPALTQNWPLRWPHGLAIPNPDLPNRDPLALAANPALADPASDPLLPRAPLDIWRAPDVTAFVVGLAGMLDSAAVRALPRSLVAPLARLRTQGRFAARPFSLELLTALQAETGNARRVALPTLPPPRTEPATAVAAASPLVAPFRTHCASCHDTTLPHPPNFLHGSPAEVEAQLDHCAERIFVRLSRAHAPSGSQGVAAMPPAAALAARGFDAARWIASPEFAALQRAAAARLGGRDPRALLRQPYPQLHRCLPAPADTRRTPDAASL